MPMLPSPSGPHLRVERSASDLESQEGPFYRPLPSSKCADLTAIGIDRFEGDYIIECSAHSLPV